jgi:hypothetical protein
MRAFLFGLALSGLVAAPALACGPAVKGVVPPIVAELDDHLASAAKNIVEAFKVQEEAMGILGYRKALMRCGPGSYAWMKVG